MFKSCLIASSVLLFAVALPAQAEVLSIAEPTYRTPNSAAGVLRPSRGMTMSQVEAKFGSAVKKYAAIGEPPITRWRYPQFDVFFEHNLVLHSVVLRQQ
ncbi:MAG TPA: hypothetical protein VFM76_06310 [Methylophaga sp.]|nr:hypothetical protein [Methylophaga sp.]